MYIYIKQTVNYTDQNSRDLTVECDVEIMIFLIFKTIDANTKPYWKLHKYDLVPDMVWF